MTPRQNIDEVLKQYTEKDYEQSLQVELQIKQDIEEMMKTKGWSEFFYPMMLDIIEKLNRIDDISTLKELEARKQAHSALKHLLNNINALVDKGNGAMIKLSQYDQLRNS